MEKSRKFILFRPFPVITSLRSKILISFLIASFVFFFLYVFQPFGLSNVKGPFEWVVFTYGLVTLGVMLFVNIVVIALFPSIYNEDRWTVLAEVLHVMLIIVLVALGNLLLSVFYGFFPLDLNRFLMFMSYTIAVGIFPVVFEVLIRQIIYQKQNQQKSVEAEEHFKAHKSSDRIIEFHSDEGKLEISLKQDDVLYLESADNYVVVYYKDQQGIKKTMIRNTLVSYEEKLQDLDFFRTHRSYLVNLNCIKHVAGNARGYELYFDDTETSVPVSRRKLKEFDEVVQGF